MLIIEVYYYSPSPSVKPCKIAIDASQITSFSQSSHDTEKDVVTYINMSCGKVHSARIPYHALMRVLQAANSLKDGVIYDINETGEYKFTPFYGGKK